MKPSLKHKTKARELHIQPKDNIGPKLFIHGFLKKIGQEQLFLLFSKYGQVLDVFIPSKPKEQKMYAFVEYARTSEGMLAIEELHCTLQFGCKIFVRFRKRRQEATQECCCLCRCHAAKQSDIVRSPMKKKRVRTNFGKTIPITFKKSMPASDHKHERSDKAPCILDETTEETIGHSAQSPSSRGSSYRTLFAFQPKPFQEFILKDEQDDYFL